MVMLMVILVVAACSKSGSQTVKNDMIFVEGGTYVRKATSYDDQEVYDEEVVIADFYISKFEVTQKEWREVMGTNPSNFKGDHLPVEMVSWYEAIEYCNLRSIKEGLEPYYIIDKNNKDPNNTSEYDPVKWTVTINEGANGYRLPTEAEWEYAASGGKMSQQHTYSGSNQADEVGYYWQNSGKEYLSGDWNWPAIVNNQNMTHPVGSKAPNELGLYDMSGNVREWCWDWYEDFDFPSGLFRIVKGGGWMGDVSNMEITFRGKFEASGYGPDQGFRVARNA